MRLKMVDDRERRLYRSSHCAPSLNLKSPASHPFCGTHQLTKSLRQNGKRLYAYVHHWLHVHCLLHTTMSSSNNYDLWEEEKKRSIGGEWQTTCTTNHHQHVVDIELGRKQVPKAVGFLTWKDDFFATSQTSESQNNDLVAVFDRDHESLVSYYMKVSIANQVIPTMTFLMLAALLMSLVFWMLITTLMRN